MQSLFLTIKKGLRYFLLLLLLGAALGLSIPHSISAASKADELKASIDSRSNDISTLQKEIDELNSKLTATGEAKKTLADTLADLETTRKKLDASISLTSKQIELANLTLETLSDKIDTRQGELTQNKESLMALLQDLSTKGDPNILTLALSGKELGESLAELEAISTIQKTLYDKSQQVKTIKSDLETNKSKKEGERAHLAQLKAQLADQKKIADQSRDTGNKLLAQTKNQETNYKKLLADKLAKKAEFEKELSDFQSQLKIVLNTSLLPGANALAWPLDKVRITQYFGDTEFSRSHTAVYNGKGHNGVDLAASIGTPVHAARLGTIIGTGNTDLVCPGASYGQWVLIRHDNGLSTLYAHLSLIKVSEGQTVATGDVIGYSGFTGYATGPHLHFTVYATQAVSVASLKSKVPTCGTYRLPIAPINGYLDPLQYLPQ